MHVLSKDTSVLIHRVSIARVSSHFVLKIALRIMIGKLSHATDLTDD